MRSLVFITVVAFTTTLCSKKAEVKDIVKSQIFMEKPGNRSMRWVELSYDEKDSIHGVFYGPEKLEDGTPIYYRSEMTNVRFADGYLLFKISKYLVRKKPFDSDVKGDDELNLSDKTGWPVSLKFPQRCVGVLTSDSLRLDIIPPYTDSAFDRVVLLRTN